MDNGNEKQLVGADPFKVQLKGATRAQLFLIVFSLGFSVLVILFQPKMFEASVTIIPGASSWNSNESTEFVLLNKNHPLYQGRRSGDAYITYGNVESLFLTQSFLDFITRRLSTEFAASDRLCASNSDSWRRMLRFWSRKCNYILQRSDNGISLDKKLLAGSVRFDRQFKSQALKLTVLSDDPEVAETFLKLILDGFRKYYTQQLQMSRSKEGEAFKDLVHRVNDKNIKASLSENFLKYFSTSTLANVSDLSMFHVVGDVLIAEAAKWYVYINFLVITQLLVASIFLTYVCIKVIIIQ